MKNGLEKRTNRVIICASSPKPTIIENKAVNVGDW